jgi:RimJ/RimL family protein N-acetyltransferase
MLCLARNRIETDRLMLRQPVLDDAKRMSELGNTPAISHRLATMPYPYGEADAVEFIDRVAANEAITAFAVILKPLGNVLIGGAGYGVNEAGEMDFGYWLGTDYWGHGYATEAGQAVLTHAFCIARVDVIETDYQLDNLASARVLAKLGFREAGHRKRHSLGAGREVETMMVQLTCDDWLDARACA